MTTVLKYDIVILGGGPAGMSAGLYASRGGAKVAILDISLFGGQPSNYLEIENYLGFSKISGYDLSEKFESHIDDFHIDKYPCCNIASVDLENKIILTEDYSFYAKAIIIATGSSPKKLYIQGEDEFFGKGVSYCAICDAPFYINKDVAVIGGGNSALEEACYLTKFAKKVYIIHRRDEFRADSLVIERAKNNAKIEFMYNHIPIKIIGENFVNQLIIQSVSTKVQKALNVSGVFPYIGMNANIDLFKNSNSEFLNERGFIKVDKYKQVFGMKGIYAIGDVTDSVCKQVITAVADGAVAGTYAVKYVDNIGRQ